ncbi:MAG: diguanylate cyclase (GGDEF)-like protein [Paraglaciecola sp.]|jgi:diguanylate cyclase (GGDEF)-like protein
MMGNPVKVSHKINQSGLIFFVSLACLLGLFAILKTFNISAPERNISRGIQYYHDLHGEMEIATVQSMPESAWQTEKNEYLNFGMTDNPYWLKFKLAQRDNTHPWLIELDYALLDSISVWFMNQQQVVAQYHGGDNQVFSQRKIRHEKFLFPIPEIAGPLVVFVKIQSSGTIKAPLRLWQEPAYLVFNGEHSIAMGLFFGFMAAMGLSNFFFFITTRQNTFLVYSGYVLCLALTLASLHGLGYKYLWPQSPWLQEHAIALYANATLFFAIIFTDLLLDVRARSPKISIMLKISAGIFLVSLCISLLLPQNVFIKSFLVMLCLAVILIFAVGLWLWFKGVQIARFYTLAWTALLISVFIASLDNLGLIELDIPSSYLLMVGATIETFLLALVLAVNYNQTRQQMFDAQETALGKERDMRKAQDSMLELQQTSKHALEYSVQERTLELQITLRELSEKNKELAEKNTLDALTNIRNRSYFDKKYLAEVRRSRREYTELSVVMIDIDNFKQVNDNHGHLVGDDCIKFVAQALQNVLKRPSDDVCRFGGEEFALIMPSTDPAGARALVERVRLEIESTPVTSTSSQIHLTISAGICSGVIESGQAEDVLIACADQQLYKAKNRGRNQVCSAQLPHQLDATIGQ